MKHLTHVSQAQPAPATTLLQWQQKAAVFGAIASGLGGLANAFNVFTQAQERKEPDA